MSTIIILIEKKDSYHGLDKPVIINKPSGTSFILNYFNSIELFSVGLKLKYFKT